MIKSHIDVRDTRALCERLNVNYTRAGENHHHRRRTALLQKIDLYGSWDRGDVWAHVMTKCTGAIECEFFKRITSSNLIL